jgi:MoxR-like ATPase
MSDSNPLTGAASDVGMVEFLCATCGRKLKVSMAYAGKPAKCPQCNAVQTVPSSSAPAASSSPPGFPSSPAAFPGMPSSPPNGFPSPGMGLSGGASSFSPASSGFPTGGAGSPAPTFPAPTFPASNYPAPSYPNPGVSPMSSGMPMQPSAPMAPAAPTSSFSPLIAQAPKAPTQSSMRMSSANPTGQRTATKQLFDRMMAEIGKIYVGQDELVVGTLVALFSNGHVLIESVPGLGKTLFVRTLGRVMGLKFGRIQFTADLMPSDITGAPIFDMKTQEFRFRPGPVFTQLLLADEINRAPAKTHASLLEIMQEFRVTVDGQSHRLEKPFLVLATQNPIESEGTYNLPEAQLDRFMFKLIASYPAFDEEKNILQLHSGQADINRRLEEDLAVITSPDEIQRTIQENGKVVVDDKLVDYVAKLVRATRTWPQFHLGASPRAGLAILQAARTLAAFHGRDYAVPDDVVQIAIPALRHRVILTAEAEVEGRKVDDLLQELIRTVEVPRL